MEKEFEEIRADKLRIGLLGLKRLFEANKEKISKDEIMAFDFTFMNITKALTELKQIKEAKPSEALEILETLADDGLLNKEIGAISYNQIWLKNKIEVLKQALLKAQEQEKKIEKLKEWFMELNKKLEKLIHRKLVVIVIAIDLLLCHLKESYL